jgi:hypothetical protein
VTSTVLIQGGCLCGAVRYEIIGPVPPGAYCHCTMCRRTSGSVAAAWVSVPRQHFRFVQGQPAIHRSSAHAERSFCATCGSQLTFFSERSPQDIDVALGSLDQAEQHPPDRHVFTSTRLPWLHLDEELPDDETWSTPGHGAPSGT